MAPLDNKNKNANQPVANPSPRVLYQSAINFLRGTEQVQRNFRRAFAYAHAAAQHQINADTQLADKQAILGAYRLCGDFLMGYIDPEVIANKVSAIYYYNLGKTHGCASCEQEVRLITLEDDMYHRILWYTSSYEAAFLIIDYDISNWVYNVNNFGFDRVKYFLFKLINFCEKPELFFTDIIERELEAGRFTAMHFFDYLKNNTDKPICALAFFEFNRRDGLMRKLNRELAAYIDENRDVDMDTHIFDSYRSELADNFIDPISREYMQIPVSLNGVAYDLRSLHSLPIGADGFRVIPNSNQKFTFMDVQPNKDLLKCMRDEINRMNSDVEARASKRRRF